MSTSKQTQQQPIVIVGNKTLQLAIQNTFTENRNFSFRLINDPKTDISRVIEELESSDTIPSMLIVDLHSIPEGYDVYAEVLPYHIALAGEKIGIPNERIVLLSKLVYGKPYKIGKGSSFQCVGSIRDINI